MKTTQQIYDETRTDRVIQDNALPVFVTNDSVVGGATAANQVTGNTSLASIDSKTPASVQRAIAILITSSSGTRTAGAKSVSFANIGSANGSVATVAIIPGEVNTFVAPDKDTLPAITYDATGTSFKIIEVR